MSDWTHQIFAAATEDSSVATAKNMNNIQDAVPSASPVPSFGNWPTRPPSTVAAATRIPVIQETAWPSPDRIAFPTTAPTTTTIMTPSSVLPTSVPPESIDCASLAAEMEQDAQEAGGTSTSENPVMIRYVYQIQTQGMHSDRVDKSLMDLEMALYRELIPALFPCQQQPSIEEKEEASEASSGDNIFGPGKVRRKRRRLQTITGEYGLSRMAATPADQALSGLNGISCQTPLVQGAERCFLVGGAFTLQQQTQEGTGSSLLQQKALDLTQQLMNGGAFDGVVNEHIVSVTFVRSVGADEGDNLSEWEPPALRPIAAGELPNSTSSGSSSSNTIASPPIASERRSLPTGVLFTLGLSSGLCIFGIFLLACGRRRRRHHSRRRGKHDGRFDVGGMMMIDSYCSDGGGDPTERASSQYSLPSPYPVFVVDDEEDDYVYESESDSTEDVSVAGKGFFPQNPYLTSPTTTTSPPRSPQAPGFAEETGILI